MAGRKPKLPPSPFNGLSLDDWQRSPLLVQWAKRDEMFSQVLSVVQNGFCSVPAPEFEGYRRAFNLLVALRVEAPVPKPLPPADYSEPVEEFREEENAS
jgi:hypothetical protein